MSFLSRADVFVTTTLRLAESTVTPERHRQIVANVRMAFAPRGYWEHCLTPEACAGADHCMARLGKACNE